MTQTPRCDAIKTDPSTNNTLQCALQLGHSGPHQANESSAQGIMRVFQWS